MSPARVLRYAAAAAGAGLLGCGGYVAVAWARYGRADPRRHPRDELLDRFLPEPEVDEYHRLKVRAPAAVTFAAAKQMDIQASPVVKGIFWLRAIPSLLQGQPFRPQGSRSIVAETLEQGWGVLAEVPDREIVVGAYTQPWHEHVTFRPLPPEEFAAFSEPGYVKIVWTLAAEPAGPGESWFVTRTRVAATDPEARKKFRRYWAPMSAGIILIRYAGLPLVRKQAQRQARQADKADPKTMKTPVITFWRGGVAMIEAEADIRRPAGEVFDYASDPANELEWNFRMKHIEKLTGGPVGVGARYRMQFTQGPAAISECVRFERPGFWEHVGGSKILNSGFSGTVVPQGDGSRLLLRMQIRPRGPLRLALPLVRRRMQRELTRDVVTVKARLEGARTSAGPHRRPSA